MRTALIATLSGFLSVGCGGQARQPTQATDSADAKSARVSDDAVARHNQAAALMAQHKIGEAEPILKTLAEEHPDHADLLIDYAIAVMHREKGGAQGIPAFEALDKRFPDNDRVQYGLGYLYAVNNRYDEADAKLQAVYARLARGDGNPGRDNARAHCAYMLGDVAANRDKSAEAAEWFSKAMQADPYFYNAAFRYSSMLRYAGKAQEAADALKLTEYLRAHPHVTIAEPKHRRMGPLLDVMPLGQRTAESGAATAPTLGGASDVLAPPTPLVAGEWRAQPLPSANVTVCDLDMDGRLDLFFAGVYATVGDKTLPNAVLKRQPDGSFALQPNHPLAAVTDATAVLWGDVDNDGRTDAYFCRKAGNRLWRQGDEGGWSDATTAFQAAGLGGDCTGGLLFDLDHDGDLDLLLLYAAGPNEVLRNNGKGAFGSTSKELGLAGPGKGSKQVCVAELNGDGIDDLVIVHADGSADAAIFEPSGRYAVRSLAANGVLAAVQLDRRLLRASASELSADDWRCKLERAKDSPLATVDLTGDGVDDVLFVGSDGALSFVVRDAGIDKTLSLTGLDRPACWTAANLDPERGPSVVALTKSGLPTICNPGPNRAPFVALAFVGDRISPNKLTPTHKSNRSGIGVTARVQIGAKQVVQSDLGRTSAPGQSLQPLAFGLGGARKADFVFIHWSNGDFQCEYPLEAGKLRTIKELDRTPEDSCPLLFAWDGEKQAFVSDFLGVGGIDYLVRPGEFYTPSDPREYLLLPAGLPQAKNGKLSLTIVEAVEELTLIDRAALVAYDLPPGWRMTLDERHSALNPPVTHEPRFFRKLQPPVSAVDRTGRDVTAALAKADGRAAPPNDPDRALPGRFLEPHVVTLEFAEPLDAHAGKPTLIADGWVRYPNAQSVIGAAQAGVDFKAPRLEAQDSAGAWKVVYPEFGYPAGMQRQMSLPLVDLPKGCTKLRIETELEAYWDAFAVAWMEPCPQAKRLPLTTVKAELAKIGSPRYTPNVGDRPFGFDFADRNPFWPVRAHAGLYTRFGDCKELIADVDDAPATVGPGEGIHLEFAPPTAPAEGWTRRYVLETRGWCRGMRIYTRHGTTVEPLPTTGLPAEVRDRLIRKYNTRLVGGPPTTD